MKFLKTLMTIMLLAAAARGQESFSVTGTSIPRTLLKLNYGVLPKGVEAYDLNICNLADVRHSVTSSEIFQALSQSESNLKPIGRQIMLAAILRNQNHSLQTYLKLALTSTTGVLSVLGTIRGGRPSPLLSSAALGALIGEQLLATWNPVLTADQVEKFEAQVLEPALVMDGGSCLERTVFTTVRMTTPHRSPAGPESLHFALQIPLSVLGK